MLRITGSNGEIFVAHKRTRSISRNIIEGRSNRSDRTIARRKKSEIGGVGNDGGTMMSRILRGETSIANGLLKRNRGREGGGEGDRGSGTSE